MLILHVVYNEHNPSTPCTHIYPIFSRYVFKYYFLFTCIVQHSSDHPPVSNSYYSVPCYFVLSASVLYTDNNVNHSQIQTGWIEVKSSPKLHIWFWNTCVDKMLYTRVYCVYNHHKLLYFLLYVHHKRAAKPFSSIHYVMDLLVRKESWQSRYLWKMLLFILYSKSKGG